MADAMHLQRLISEAEDLGADRAAPLPAVAVVVDDRVNLKCRVPLCRYGTTSLRTCVRIGRVEDA